MNKQQEHLLQLLKEIDGICRKHDITYYTAGGTVIGAVRHKGFIPWDDDVDLYMTRDNFEKFRQAFKEESPADRKLEFKDDNSRYHATIPRYNEETSTQICRYHLLGNLSGGLLIDILIMDDFPNDAEVQKDYLAKLNVYADMIALPYTHSHRNIDKYLDYYNVYMDKVKESGKAAVLEEIEQELFHFSPEECDSYILRWAALPIILPKKMMGTPVYFDFEDMKIPVPEDWYWYLSHLYGLDWANVPLYEGQETHIAVSDMEIPYSVFMNERNRVIKQDEAKKRYYKRKWQSINVQRVRRPIEDYILDIKTNALLHMQRKHFSDDIIVQRYAEKAYEEVVGFYQDYINLQTSVLFVGELKHPAWLRWNDPKVIPIPKENLELLLLALMKIGRLRVADKLISVYERARKSECISKTVYNLNAKVKRVESLYYQGFYRECLSEFEDGLLQDVPRAQKIRYLAQAALCPDQEMVVRLRELVERAPEDMELTKAYGDALYQLGQKDDAVTLYQKVLNQSRNGMFWRDIQEKIGLAPTLISQPSPYTPGNIEIKERLLIDEIVDICKENDIKYMFSRGVAKQLLYAGNFGYANTIKTIYMDAKNAEKFLEAVKKNPRSDRKVFSWENNRRLRDFKLVYSDVNSVYASLDRVDEWKGIGIHVDIIILRAAYASKKREKLSALKEIVLNVVGLSPTDMGAVSSKKRKLAYFLICSVFFKVIRPEIYARWLFRGIMRREMRATPVRYFFRKNKVKGLFHDYFVSADQYNTLTEILLDDKSYAISEIDKLFLEKVKKYDEEPISNVPPKESLFLLVRDELTWDELEGMIDREAYNELDWSELRVRQKKLTKTNEKIKNMWVLMNRGKDKADFILEYLNLQEKITFNGYPYKYSDMDALMESYDYKVRFYWEKKMTFFATPALTTQYIAFLREAGRTGFAKKLKAREGKEKYLLEKDLLLEKLREIYGLCK